MVVGVNDAAALGAVEAAGIDDDAPSVAVAWGDGVALPLEQPARITTMANVPSSRRRGVTSVNLCMLSSFGTKLSQTDRTWTSLRWAQAHCSKRRHGIWNRPTRLAPTKRTIPTIPTR